MNIKAHLNLRSRTIILAVSAMVLTWLVLSRSFGAFLAGVAPQAALWISPRQPEALVSLADSAVNNPETVQASAGDQAVQPKTDAAVGAERDSGKATENTQNLAQAFSAFETIGRNETINRPFAIANASIAQTWAVTALENDPLNADALRILGQLAEADGDDAGASKYMHAADRLSLHQGIATFWLLRTSVRASDYKSALHYADILLRTNPGSYPYVVPILAQLSEDKTGETLIKSALAENPPWRKQFLAALPNNVTDARTPLNLLLALRDNPVPPTAHDIEPYLRALIGHQFYRLAYYTWLQFLPPDELRHAGLLFNGSFEATLSGVPFDWTIVPGSGVTIDIVPRSDKGGQHALLVDFQYGRVDYHSVTELVMLAPGDYVFTGQYKGELVGPRGLKWRVVCANGTITNGGESAMINGKTKDWRDVTFTFTVPPKDCAAQYVRLDLDARMASETLITGSMLFDDLQISRAANPSTSGG
jgi:hypothetical protein